MVIAMSIATALRISILLVVLGTDVGFQQSFAYSIDNKVDHLNAKPEETEIVYPERIDHKRARRDILLENKNSDDDDVRFKVKAFGRSLILDVTKNKVIVPKDFFVRSFSKEGKQTLDKSTVKSCQYQGHVQGHPKSSVVLDMCNGLSGIIEDDREKLSIVPINAKGFNAHKITRTSGWNTLDAATQNFSCGTSPSNYLTDLEKKVGMKDKRKRPRRSLTIDHLFRNYIPVNKTRYTELYIIVDKAVYDKYGSNQTEIEQRVFRLVNAVDMIYQKINIRIILKGLDIWTENDSVPFNNKAGTDLINLQKYREKHLDQYKCDTLHLLRGIEWTDHGGMAYLGEMCTVRSTGVVGWNEWSILGPWLALAHEMGHNFGFGHDDLKKCKCLTPRGCIMRTFKTRVPGFSDCNLRDLRKIDDSCLYNIPFKSYNMQCGNGIKEKNEECDCGTTENCAILDPCCNPKTCRLHSSSQCSNHHDTCCRNCQYAPTGAVCRSTEGDCDVQEFCNGKSGQCPTDDHKRDGSACLFDDLELIGNNINNKIKKTRLPSRIKAKYIRINPQHWRNNICMRTEIYGCEKVWPNDTATSIRSANNLCVEANYGICDSKDTSELVFKESDNDCTMTRNMQFKLSNEGMLIHHCTGNMVCPKESVVQPGTKLVVKNSCNKDAANFTRIGKSLMHIKSGYCVHPNNGLALQGVSLVLWPSCEGQNIALTFVKPDCETALGMERGGISNDRIKASSFLENKEAFHARLNGVNAWCAGKRAKNQYLQIDLGTVMFISAIATEGMYDGRRVTGYKLYYSEDGQRWIAYTGPDKKHLKISYCFSGKCSATHNSQCRDIWGSASSSASKACYDKFNTKMTGYGTCDPARNQSCLPQHALCGQLQCFNEKKATPAVDYGISYKRHVRAGMNCSLAVRKTTIAENLGMVQNGTECGKNKICVNYTCISVLSLSTQFCPRHNGLECAGNGFCTAFGNCYCKEGYDPRTNCSSVISAVNGGWSSWSSWSNCTRVCDGGTKTKYRFCDTPVPSLSGRKCRGKRINRKRCKRRSCPVAQSCRHLQAIGRRTGTLYPSGVYTINPAGHGNVAKTYCDMSRDGGGWTLLVSSHTNTWTPSNVQKRVENSLTLDQDFSILFVANDIKNAINVRGSYFEYRIEAQQFGRWGGIWKAPRSYSFTSTNNKQTKVKLIHKFDKWRYEEFGIEKRMPWIHGAMLTTSVNATKYAFGSITSNIKRFYPAPWINAKENEQHPTNIWYWMREGDIQNPRSCMELQLMGLESTPLSSGVHTFKLRGAEIKTYCDLSTYGGGWTLLVTSTSPNGWTRKTVRTRNVEHPSLNRDFSILDFSDDIIGKRHFQYRIEDDTNTWGGIFEAQMGQSFLSSSSSQNRIQLLLKHGDWNETSNLAQRVPYTKDWTLLLTTAGNSGDSSGTLVSSSLEGIDLPNKRRRPLRLWVREGTWRSCNEIKTNRNATEKYLEDGLYMIKNTSYQYLPVMCDMKSNDGAWTLLVTSANNGWHASQVKARSTNLPSLTRDYSILELGDQIKELSGGKTFMYKLEANERGHWGGVWKVSRQYSFVATNNSQTNVTLVKKYDEWHYNWRNSLEKRMPWIGKRKGLLTTSTNCDYFEWGSIISDQTINNPAPWIDYTITNPGVIWYWVNEDDCGPNRTSVDGGLSPWSAWSGCSPLCNVAGVQTRKRLCTNPAPRCRGRSCDVADLLPVKRQCSYCPKSPIRGWHNLCIQPSTADCNPPENTSLVYKKDSNNCSQDYMDFLFDTDGMLMHMCSGKYVCPQDGLEDFGNPLVLSSLCEPSRARFETTINKGLKHKQSGHCIHPDQGRPAEGTQLVTWTGCKSLGDRLMLDLFELLDDNNDNTLNAATRPPKTKIPKVSTIRDSPIRSEKGFCLQPSTADCSPADGTQIIYSGAGGDNVQCSMQYMLFTLTTTGVLKHTCSGKYLCPDYVAKDGSLFNGTPVVLKNKCVDNRTKYTRTSAKSLQHISSGFCVHPETPKPGTKAVFWDLCDENRLKLDFYKLRD